VIDLKTPAQIGFMRQAGQVLTAAIRLCRDKLVTPGVSTLEIDQEVEALIRHRGAKPAFKGYRGFPASVCVSINEEVVHGIPAAHRRLKEGDIVGLDFGAIVDGFYADAAVTVPVGEIPADVQRLLDVTRESLDLAIAAARPGNRLGDISAAVQQHVEAAGFGVVRAFVGHGVGEQFHTEPSVPHYFERGARTIMEPGMTFTIEPMITMGTWKHELWDDGWTAVTADGSRTAQFEHTVAVTDNGVDVLTLID
jgi:methionyl aminopeptidase